jgi:hypothetical protein
MNLQVGVVIRGMLTRALKPGNRMAEKTVSVFSSRIPQGELPCHSQMNNQPMAIQLKDEVFRPSLQITNCLARELLTHCLGSHLENL